MGKIRQHQWCKLPAGRLLYEPSEEQPFVVVSRNREEYWLVGDGWAIGDEAAGPFRSYDILRAYRLANTLVPDGCELGPWQYGIALFLLTSLPGKNNDWSHCEPSWLASSVSLYSAADILDVPREGCCVVPTDRPRVDWVPADTVAKFDSLIELVRSRYPELVLPTIATLTRSWNVHPIGSPLFAESKMFGGTFVVVDLPPDQ